MLRRLQPSLPAPSGTPRGLLPQLAFVETTADNSELTLLLSNSLHGQSMPCSGNHHCSSEQHERPISPSAESSFAAQCGAPRCVIAAPHDRGGGATGLRRARDADAHDGRPPSFFGRLPRKIWDLSVGRVGGGVGALTSPASGRNDMRFAARLGGGWRAVGVERPLGVAVKKRPWLFRLLRGCASRGAVGGRLDTGRAGTAGRLGV